jgi:very-short-patch-repair endonuclease
MLDVISTVRGLRLNGLLVPKWLAEEYIPIEQGHVAKPVVPQSRADKLVAQRYAFLHPGNKAIANSLVDGFRLDMFFPDINLNVELDGPTHMYPARARFDAARDAYLTKKGIEVMRIKLFGKSVDKVIEVIQSRVDTRADKVEEEKIQKIYASETEIRKIYSPRKGRK